MVTAVLAETVSIQKYVFASNKLKENLGASYLVSKIYSDDLKWALEKTLNTEVDTGQWLRDMDRVLMKEKQVPYEIGYIGGGNALLFFGKRQDAEEFVKQWTMRLLLKAPSLQTAVALADIDIHRYSEEKDRLFLCLAENKNKYHPSTCLSKHGITADCPFSGLSADVYYKDKDGERYISSASKSKILALNISRKEFLQKYCSQLNDKYTLTTEIDSLGQVRGESHIAVVHIDGNGMGARFRNCSDLPALRKLSHSVATATEDAFRELIFYVAGHMDFFMKNENGFEIAVEDGKPVLPLLPIIIAGDDVTFVTDGRLGIHLAEKFIEFWAKKSASDGKPLTACAGVAITRTKFPFFRSYNLAEELCSSAKKEARQNGDISMLDYHIISGGFSGTLAEIREKQYLVKQGTLHYGPYFIGNDREKSMMHLRQALKELGDATIWPRSKVKELRQVLPLGKEATREYITGLKTRDLKLPDFGGNYAVNGWDNDVTPYYDVVELLDFYPPYFLA